MGRWGSPGGFCGDDDVFGVGARGPVEVPTAGDEGESGRTGPGEELVGGQRVLGDLLDRAYPVAEAGAVGELHLDEVARIDVTERGKHAATLDAVVDMSRQHGRARQRPGPGAEAVPADGTHVLGHGHRAAFVHADGNDRDGCGDGADPYLGRLGGRRGCGWGT